MGDFFNRWRRKVGLLTLVMALLSMGGWVRSRNTIEVITIPLWGHNAVSFQSSNGYLACERIALDERPDAEWTSCRIQDLRLLEVRAEYLGLDVSPIHDIRLSMLNPDGVPYRSITIPLTLISFWLLLKKPRKSNQKRSGGPIPSEGT